MKAFFVDKIIKFANYFLETMIDKLKELIAEAEAFKAETKEEVEAFRIKYLGSKGLLEFFLDIG